MIEHKNIINSFTGKKVLVVGDVMVDQYSYGVVDRISPEAPVPIVHLHDERIVPGGAGNVCHNLLELGANVSFYSVCGTDSFADVIIAQLKISDSLTSKVIKDKERHTTVKQRLMAGGQQLLRVDNEVTFDISKETEQELLLGIKKQIEDIDVICVSDYAKGVITKTLATEICQLAKEKNIPLVVDTKPTHFSYFSGVSVITPNESEVLTLNKNLTVETAAEKLSTETDSPILVTRGSAGMFAVSGSEMLFSFPSFAADVRDVSGAGDTVVALVSLGLAIGLSLEEAALIASHGAAIAVAKSQTSAVTLKELSSVL